MKYIKQFLFVALFVFPLFASARIEANFPGGDPTRPIEPQKDAQGNIHQKSVIGTHQYSPDIIIRTNNVKLAPASGSPGQITPIITKRNSNVMGQVSKVYLIWYGNWRGTKSSTIDGQNLIKKLVTGLADTTSSYVNVTTATSGNSLSPTYGAYNAMLSSKTLVEYYPPVTKTTLSDSDVQSLVKQAITKAGNNIPDPNAIYLVLTSSEISESSGFCSKYCGWHTYTSMSYNGITYVKYAFIGNPDKCISACAIQTTTSPNTTSSANLIGADGMASIVAHEMEEIVTDPLLNNWYNSQGYENADMCAWTFGATSGPLANGSYYNVTLGGTNFLLQRALGSNSYCYVAAP